MRSRNRGNRRTRRNNRQNVPRTITPLVSHIAYTSRIADFPPTVVNADFISNSIVLNNLMTAQLASLSGFYTEYRFTSLSFRFESTSSALDVGQVFMMFDSRFNIEGPASIDDVYARPLWTVINVHRAPAIHRNNRGRGEFEIPRSVQTQPWFRTAVQGGVPNPDDTIGTLFFGSDSTTVGNVNGHLTVTAGLSLRA